MTPLPRRKPSRRAFARVRESAPGWTFSASETVRVGDVALLISHRFSTVRTADRICVPEGGRIVEQGNHEALLALGGRYAVLRELQASTRG